MTAIEINESTDGEIYTFTLKNEDTKAAIDLTNYTAVTMTIVSKAGTTKHGTISFADPGMQFGTKASGIITYTTDTADPYPTIPAGVKELNLLGQIKITGTGLAAVSKDIEIKVVKDYSGLA